MEAPNEIRFYGRNYPLFREFSNFYIVKLDLDGKVWDSVEHFYQAMKTTDPDDQEDIRLGYMLGITKAVRTGVIKAFPNERDSKPAASKKAGKQVETSGKCREDWLDVKDDVIRKALKAKFSDAHPELKAKLLATGDAVLIEASPTDYYWGEGAAKIGRNKLGVLLMERREELKKEAT